MYQLYDMARLLTFLFTCILLSIAYLSFTQEIHGDENDDDKAVQIGNLVEMSGNWFIAYRNGIRQVQADEETPTTKERNNGFVLKRSYFTLKKNLTDIFAVRYTMDLTIDKEGEDAGNVETRLKYLYLKAKPTIHSELLSNTSIEVGMVHRPWLDYEQKINTYRVQDNMFIERNKIFNSADFGFTISGNIGEAMNNDFLKTVNSAMNGKYVSYSLGLYNGGGYSGSEQNSNKVIAGRISARPFADRLPEIHTSAYFNTGKGNNEYSPDFNQLLGFIAYTGKRVIGTAQYHTGKGDFRARYVKPQDRSIAYKNSGYSFFGEFFPARKSNVSVWGRYDSFTVERPVDPDTERIIGGLTYVINDYIRLVANTEHTTSSNETDDIYELNIEITF